MEKFSANGCRKVSIFTDNNCGHSFYDVDSCRKAGEDHSKSARFEKLKMMFYIKDLDIDRRPVAVRRP